MESGMLTKLSSFRSQLTSDGKVHPDLSGISMMWAGIEAW